MSPRRNFTVTVVYGRFRNIAQLYSTIVDVLTSLYPPSVYLLSGIRAFISHRSFLALKTLSPEGERLSLYIFVKNIKFVSYLRANSEIRMGIHDRNIKLREIY